MTLTGAIRSGFTIINKQWQLIAIQVVLWIINCLFLFLLVGIPFVISLVMLGIDITTLAAENNMAGLLQNPVGLFSKYLGLVLVVITAIFVYVVVATTLWIYVYGGTAGMIGQTLLEPSLQFSMRSFFGQAKRLFFPLMWYFFIIGLVFTAIVFVIGLFGGGAALLVAVAKSRDSTLALFLGIFFTSVVIIASLSILIAALAVTTFGIASLFFKGRGALKSFLDGVRFLWNSQKAFWLYLLLLAGYVLASILIMFIFYPLQMIPVAGAILSLPLQILSSIVQGYLGLVFLAALFAYFFDQEMRKSEPVPDTPLPGPLFAESSDPVNTSSVQGTPPEEFPPLSDEHEQA